MSKQPVSALEVLQPPLPPAALMARPVGSAPAPEGLAKEIADLREMVMRLDARVKQLEGEALRVCCECGEPGCRKAPLVPARYWQRFGRSSWGYYRRAEPEAARNAEREHYEFERRQSYQDYGPYGPGPTYFDDRALDWNEPTTKGWR